MDIMTILQIIIGFIGLVAIAIPFSDNFKIINYKYILYGILSQIVLAVILLKVPFVVNAFEILGDGVKVLQKATVEGSIFVFGYDQSFTPDAYNPDPEEYERYGVLRFTN